MHLQICLSGRQHPPQPPIIDRRSTIAHCRTFAGSLLRSRSLQVSILLFTLRHITFKGTNKPLVAAVVVWKLISDAPSIGLSRSTSIAKSTATSDSSFDAFALALGERSRGFALYLYPDMQGIVPKGLQKPRARRVSYRRRKATESQMTSIDVIRGAASFSMTSIDVIRGQRIKKQWKWEATDIFGLSSTAQCPEHLWVFFGMASIRNNFTRKQLGTRKSARNWRCAVPAEIHSICTDWPRPGGCESVLHRRTPVSQSPF